MATIEIDALCERLTIKDPVAFLDGWLWRIIKHERLAEGRYQPVFGAIVTRDGGEILLVGNQYARDEPL